MAALPTTISNEDIARYAHTIHIDILMTNGNPAVVVYVNYFSSPDKKCYLHQQLQEGARLVEAKGLQGVQISEKHQSLHGRL